MIIPANKLHLNANLKPIGIGRVLTTKVNANIGTSSAASSVETEIKKMEAALAVGADTIMDLSTGGDLDQIRQELLAQCPVPFGTVPVYQVVKDKNVEDVDRKTIFKVIEKQVHETKPEWGKLKFGFSVYNQDGELLQTGENLHYFWLGK